jgi:hypothetical protein
LIAEDITSRFLSVISLFNGTVPLIAIQMQALKVGDATTLVFTKVLDELSRGLVDEDEDAEAAPADRAYWEQRGPKQQCSLRTNLMAIIRELDGSLEPKYNRYYIGISKNGRPFNFVRLRPLKTTLTMLLKLPRSDDIDGKINTAGLDTLEYDNRSGAYRLSLDRDDIETKKAVLTELIKAAHQNWAS